jgi:hypothetical protein
MLKGITFKYKKNSRKSSAPAEYKEKRIMKELLIITVIVGVYLLMQLVILPKMGIST